MQKVWSHLILARCVLIYTFIAAGCGSAVNEDGFTSKTVRLPIADEPAAYAPTLDGPVRALSTTPFGHLSGDVNGLQISITFSKPMVPLGTTAADQTLIRVEPTVQGVLTWRGTQTLVLDPDEPVAFSTRYDVTVRPGLVAVSGDTLRAAIRWSFQTPTPEVSWVDPAHGASRLRPSDTLRIGFNQPVDAGTAKQYVSLQVGKSLTPDIELSNIGARTLQLVPNDRLPLNSPLQLRLRSGLPGTQGHMGMVQDTTFDMRTYGPLRLTGISSSYGSKKYAAGSALLFEFSNPVPMRSFASAVTLSPETPFARGAGPDSSATSTTIRWPVELLPSTRYSVKISGLVDVFGQRLPDIERTFESDSYPPEVSLPSGVLVVEKDQAHRLSVSSVNVQNARLGMLAISKDQIIPNLDSFGQNYPDYYADPDEGTVPTQPLDLEAGRNQWKTQPVDLSHLSSSNPAAILVNAFVPKQKGWYGGRAYKSIVQITNLGITAKYSPHQILVLVSTLRSASPVPDAAVTIRDADNRVRWSGTTGPDGLALAPGWDSLGIRSDQEWSRPRIYVFAEKDADLAFSSSEDVRGIEPYRLGVTYDWNPTVNNFGGSVFTDRGLYRTGETVSLKGILRHRTDGDWSPVADSVYATIRSPLNESVFVSRFKPSEFGSVDWTWAIPSKAAQGTYRVELSSSRLGPDEYSGGELGSGIFRVDAFRTSTFAVSASTPLQSYVAGDIMEGTISGRYLFGAPMIGQPVRTTVTRGESFFSLPEYEGYRFGGSPVNRGDNLFSRLARTDTLLDVNGKATMHYTLPGNEFGMMADVTVEGEVTDPARQSLAAHTVAKLHPGLFYVGLRPGTTFLDLNEKKEQFVDVISVDPNGASVGSDSIQIRVLRQQWNSVREVGADGRLRWKSDLNEEVVHQFAVSTRRGSAERVAFPVTVAGSYVIRATTRDVRGNSIRTDAYFYSTGSGYVAWERKDDDLIKLVADQSSYDVGATARILVPSPFESATALISVEREGIISSRIETLTGSAPSIEIPFDDRHLPNAFVSVILLSGRTAAPSGMQDIGAPGFRIGYVNLSVNPEQRRLQVSVLPSKNEARPGDDIEVEFEVRDERNRGVAAEITFSAADAGVLNLIGYMLPDPFDAFYGERPLGVSSTESRAHLVRQRNFGQKEEDSGGGGGGSAGSTFLRTDFRPLAHWDPSIRTDKNGKARIRFKLPESLTTFRLMATAASRDSRFGSSSKDVVVTKPLVMQPALPRFARIGDEFNAGVLISNQTDKPGSARVSATSALLELAGAGIKEVALQPGETREVAFVWKAPATGTAAIAFRATMGDETDALESTIPVERPLFRSTFSTLGQTESIANESLLLPGEREQRMDSLSVTIAGSALVGIDGAMEYLLEYPYGCLEQITSRIRPLLISSDLVEAFGLTLPDGDADEQVREWIAQLPDFWTGNGFALWPGGRYSPPFVNAYVVAALAEASRAGYQVPGELTRQAVESLERSVRSRSEKPDYYSDRVWAASRSFMLYALTQHGRVLEDEIASLADTELQRQSGVSIESMAFLLRAVTAADRESLQRLREPLLSRLRSMITVEGSSAYVVSPEDTEWFWIYASTRRSTALAITAIVEAAPGDSSALILQRMIRYLLDRRSNGRWSSTQENIYAVEAFAAYFRTFEVQEPNMTASVAVAGQEVLSGSIQSRTAVESRTGIVPAVPASSSSVPVRLQRTGTGTLNYSLRLDTYSTVPPASNSNGLSIIRVFEHLDESGTPTSPEQVVGEAPVSLAAGQLVRVTIRVNSRADRNYVVVDDALPAGLEALNVAFVTTSDEATRDTGTSRWWGSFNHTEIRNDRVLLFADYLERGDHSYTYVARATTPGTFRYPPASAEQLYDPSVFGRTTATRLTVSEGVTD